MLKKNRFLIVLFPLFYLTSIALSDIVPLSKPTQTVDETQKKLLIDVLKPLPKPIKKTQKKIIKEKDIVKKDKKNNFILPKKKPLIAGSEKAKNIKISKYYNKKDFNLESLNESPLGAAALTGTSFNIDRNYTSKKLGFKKPTNNSIDTVADRDFVLDFLFAVSVCSMHISRIAEELIICNSDGFILINFSLLSLDMLFMLL